MITTDLEFEECSVSRSREPKKKPTRLRSIKLSRVPSLKTSMKQAKSQHNPGEADGSSNYIEASSCNSDESGFDFNDKNRKCLIRKSSMKPVRILTKTVSLRHKKRPSVRRASVDSSGSPVDKPTCSSTLRGSKFPDDVEIQPTANGVAVKKVCPYTYCSLHGHKKHEPSPPLKRFLSTRRRQLIKSQKGTKPENQNQSQQTQRAKQSGNKKKGGLNSQTVKNGGLDVEKSKEVISGCWGGGKRSWVGVSCVREVEAMAIQEALSWLSDRGWLEVSIESDLLSVIEAIQTRGEEIGACGLIIGDIVDLSDYFARVSFDYVPRSANGVAHALARSSRSIMELDSWLGTSGPACIHALLLDDL